MQTPTIVIAMPAKTAAFGASPRPMLMRIATTGERNDHAVARVGLVRRSAAK